MARRDFHASPAVLLLRLPGDCQLTVHCLQGYALVEYETKDEALKAIQEAPQEPFLEKVLSCDFAFVQPPAGCVRHPRSFSWLFRYTRAHC